MLYKFSVTVPVSTLAANPSELAVKLSPGHVSSLSITFPAGCEGLVGIRILRGAFQLWPLTSTDWIDGDDHTHVIPARQQMRSGETRLRILAYNLDTSNEHTVSISFTVDGVPSATPQHLGIVSAELPDYVREDIANLAAISQELFDMAQSVGESVIPLLSEILDRLEPDTATRIRSMTLEELSRL